MGLIWTCVVAAVASSILRLIAAISFAEFRINPVAPLRSVRWTCVVAAPPRELSEIEPIIIYIASMAGINRPEDGVKTGQR